MLNRFRYFHFIGSKRLPKIAIVGSGPAGFYTAHKLLQLHENNIQIDMIEAMPVPFGLVRHGVAPDHPEVKNVQNKFERVASNPSVNFFGNVKVGKDITLKELVDIYDSVVLAYGASRDKTLGIENEHLNNIFGAREFVGWYNGYPSSIRPNFEKTKTAVIIGMGNVALDIARVLLSPPNVLAKTDITENALGALRKSSIEKVVLMGRRGPVQAAFTAKELREMFQISSTKCVVNEEYLKSELTRYLPLLKKDKSKARLMNLLYTKSKEQDFVSNDGKEWELKFLASPTAFYPSTDDPLAVGSVEYSDNELSGSLENPSVLQTSNKHFLDTSLVIKSIGYEIAPVEGLPFDPINSRIPNNQGRVVEMPNLYVAGWLKTGPKGTIAATMMNSYETANSISADIKIFSPESLYRKNNTSIAEVLKKRHVHVVDFPKWKSIEKEEVRRGKLMGKPREKIADIQEILDFLRDEKNK